MTTAIPPTDCPGDCPHAQANKARALELKRVRDELRELVERWDSQGFKSAALEVNGILEGGK